MLKTFCQCTNTSSSCFTTATLRSESIQLQVPSLPTWRILLVWIVHVICFLQQPRSTAVACCCCARLLNGSWQLLRVRNNAAMHIYEAAVVLQESKAAAHHKSPLQYVSVHLLMPWLALQLRQTALS
jgi:hypothetical protein